MHKGKVAVEKGKYKVIDCEMCGFKHLDPIPSKEEIKEFYERQYYQEKIPKLLDPEKEEKNYNGRTYGIETDYLH